MKKHRIALFVSGVGSNALNIAAYFNAHPTVDVALLLTNNASSPVLYDFEKMHIPCVIVNNSEAADGTCLISMCQDHDIDTIILAGYLRLIPVSFIQAYSNRIINIHPALLPKFGGKGMYGDRVHEAVLANKSTESGITIHMVNEHFDDGRKLAQFFCVVDSTDTVESLRKKVQQLEHAYYPLVIEQTLNLEHHV
jgi:phosphoribosylglycinamide formyltransferase-1